jgi:hypothetical protein
MFNLMNDETLLNRQTKIIGIKYYIENLDQLHQLD